MIARSENYARSSKKKSREFRLLNCSGRVSGPPRPISSPPASSRCSSGKVPAQYPKSAQHPRVKGAGEGSGQPSRSPSGQRPRPTSRPSVPTNGPDALSGCSFGVPFRERGVLFVSRDLLKKTPEFGEFESAFYPFCVIPPSKSSHFVGWKGTRSYSF